MKTWPTPRAGNPGSRKPGTGGAVLGEEVKRASENSPSSPGSAADSSGPCSSDGAQLPLLSVTPTASSCSAGGAGMWPTPNVMDAAGMRLEQAPEDWLVQSRKHAEKGTHKQYPLSIAARTGIGVERDFLSIPTSAPSTPSPDRATSYRAASPASRTRRQGNVWGDSTIETSGLTPFAYCEKVRLPSGSSRTYPVSSRAEMLTDSPCSGASSVTYPKRGSMRNGACWEQTMSVPRIDASGCGSWPTATSDDADNVTRDSGQFQSLTRTVQDSARGGATRQTWATPEKACADGGHLSRGGDRKGELLLGGQVKANPGARYATPRSEDSQCAGRRHNRDKSDTLYAQTVTDTKATPGSLNPTWVEWLMGFPRGWTDCAASVTPRCLSRWLRRSRCWLDRLG
jgi:hypothetical protein